MIDDQTLDEPHGGRAATASAVNERGFGAFRGDSIEKFVGCGGIGSAGAEGNVIIAKAGRFRSSLLAMFAEIFRLYPLLGLTTGLLQYVCGP